MTGTKEMSAFKTRTQTNKYYLAIQEATEGGWDYTIYSNVGELIDGGVLDSNVDIYSAVEEIIDSFPELFGRGPEVDEIDYEALQDFVS